MLSSATRQRPVDRHVPTHPHLASKALREMSRPAPSGAGFWPKSNRNTGHKLLVDTGAQISVFPASAHERRGKKMEPLVAANGSKIDTFGT